MDVHLTMRVRSLQDRETTDEDYIHFKNIIQQNYEFKYLTEIRNEEGDIVEIEATFDDKTSVWWKVYNAIQILSVIALWATTFILIFLTSE